jgi:hypothetical protein
MALRDSSSTLQLRQSYSRSENDKFRVKAELETVKAELQRVKAESAAVQEATERLQASFTKSRRDTKVRLCVVAVLMLTAALVKIIWLSSHAPETPTSRAALVPAVSDGMTTPNPGESDTSDSLGNREFSRSLDRLRDAFHAFPEKDQMDIVREINQKHPGGPMGCPLAWNAAGVPSLFIGDKKGEAPPSMVAALNQCASEVEKLRAEKGPER